MNKALKATLILAMLFFSFIAYPPAIVFHNINGHAYAQEGQPVWNLTNGLLSTTDHDMVKIIGTDAFKSMHIFVYSNSTLFSQHAIVIDYKGSGGTAKGKAEIQMEGGTLKKESEGKGAPLRGYYTCNINVLMGSTPYTTQLRGYWETVNWDNLSNSVGKRITISFEEAVGAPNPSCDNQKPVLDPFKVSFLVEKPSVQQTEAVKQQKTLEKEDKAKKESSLWPDCFIATAAYGNETAEQLDTLRGFRDRVLLQSELGNQFVNTYYALSPPLADYIRDKDVLRALVRFGLEPLVIQLNSTRFLWDN